MTFLSLFRSRKTSQDLAAVTTKLVRAYDQLADGNRVSTVEEFHTYGRKWDVDTVSMVDQARSDLDRRLAEQAARMNARRAAGYRF